LIILADLLNNSILQHVDDQLSESTLEFRSSMAFKPSSSASSLPEECINYQALLSIHQMIAIFDWLA